MPARLHNGRARAHLLSVADRCADHRLRDLIERVGPLRLRRDRHATTFDALARSIVFQQLSTKAATTIFGRVSNRFSDGEHLDFERLARARITTLRGLGLSQQKAQYVRELARAQRQGQVPSLRQLGRYEDQQIVDALTRFKGVGVWTVEMLMLFWMRRPDVFPTLDLGVRKGFSRVYGLDDLASAEEMIERAEDWRPYRSAVSWYFWRAADGL